MPRRVLACLAAGLGGSGAGLLGSFAHAVTSYGAPVGLVAGLGLTLAVIAAPRLATPGRGPAACAVAGWVGVVLTLSVKRPEGDLVVPATPLGYCWLLGGLAVALATVCWPSASTDGSPPRR